MKQDQNLKAPGELRASGLNRNHHSSFYIIRARVPLRTDHACTWNQTYVTHEVFPGGLRDNQTNHLRAFPRKYIELLGIGTTEKGWKLTAVFTVCLWSLLLTEMSPGISPKLGQL